MEKNFKGVSPYIHFYIKPRVSGCAYLAEGIGKMHLGRLPGSTSLQHKHHKGYEKRKESPCCHKGNKCVTLEQEYTNILFGYLV